MNKSKVTYIIVSLAIIKKFDIMRGTGEVAQVVRAAES